MSPRLSSPCAACYLLTGRVPITRQLYIWAFSESWKYIKIFRCVIKLIAFNRSKKKEKKNNFNKRKKNKKKEKTRRSTLCHLRTSRVARWPGSVATLSAKSRAWSWSRSTSNVKANDWSPGPFQRTSSYECTHSSNRDSLIEGGHPWNAFSLLAHKTRRGSEHANAPTCASFHGKADQTVCPLRLKIASQRREFVPLHRRRNNSRNFSTGTSAFSLTKLFNVLLHVENYTCRSTFKCNRGETNDKSITF